MLRDGLPYVAVAWALGVQGEGESGCGGFLGLRFDCVLGVGTGHDSDRFGGTGDVPL